MVKLKTHHLVLEDLFSVTAFGFLFGALIGVVFGLATYALKIDQLQNKTRVYQVYMDKFCGGDKVKEYFKHDRH